MYYFYLFIYLFIFCIIHVYASLHNNTNTNNIDSVIQTLWTSTAFLFLIINESFVDFFHNKIGSKLNAECQNPYGDEHANVTVNSLDAVC